MTTPRIGLALSGGGFRATAFGLGCLRALQDRDLLQHVSVVSGISGGSLLTAMWAYGPAEFAEFDDSVVQLLRCGLQAELARRAFAPTAMVKSASSALRATVPGQRRGYSRTDALVAALASRAFGSRDVADVTHPDRSVIFSATDMTTGNAVRFGSRVSSCSAYGKILDPVTVAEAVAASAAFPILLPAMTREYEFENRDGHRTHETVVMTDGGVYDNLGLSPLLPNRSTAHTSHTYELDFLIAADAGRGRAHRRAARLLPGRLSQSFDITYGKTQDASRGRIHDAAAAGQIDGFVHAYRGMRDHKLPVPLHDLIPRERVERYPTNFAAMTTEDLTAVAVRGEQLTRLLLGHYHADLGN